MSQIDRFWSCYLTTWSHSVNWVADITVYSRNFAQRIR